MSLEKKLLAFHRITVKEEYEQIEEFGQDLYLATSLKVPDLPQALLQMLFEKRKTDFKEIYTFFSTGA
jgi:hypothetical protein